MSDSLSTLLDPRELARRFLAGQTGLPALGSGALSALSGLPGLPGLPGLMRPRQAAPQVVDASQAPQLVDASQARSLGVSGYPATAPGEPTSQGAGIAAGEASFPPAPDLPAGTVMASGPPQNVPGRTPPGQLQSIIEKAAQANGVPLQVAYALFQTESSYNPRAVGIQTSTGQAKGLGQLMDATARDYGVTDPFDPTQNANASMAKLKSLYDKTGDWATALQNYGTFSTGRGPAADAAARQRTLTAAGIPPDAADRQRLAAGGAAGPAGSPGLAGPLGMGGGAYGPYTQVIEDAKATAKAQQADTERIIGKWSSQLDQDAAASNRAAANVRQPQIQPWVQQFPNPGLAQQFGSWGSVFAVLASGFTRRPMINAMNGLAASINAMHKGDVEEYNRQYQAWKENTDLAFKNYETEREASDDAVKKLSTDQNAALNELHLNAAKYDNQRQIQSLETGAIDHLISTNEAQQRLYIELDKNRQQMELFHDLQTCGSPEACAAARKAVENWSITQGHSDPLAPRWSMTPGLGPDPTDPTGQKQIMGTWGFNLRDPNGPDSRVFYPIVQTQKQSAVSATVTPDALDFAARQWLKSGKPQYSGWGAAELNKEVQARGTQMAAAQGLTPEQVLAGQGQFKADQVELNKITAQSGSAEGYERGAIPAFDQAVRLAPRTSEALNFEPLNSWVQTGSRAFGSIPNAEFYAQLTLALDQYAKVLSGATGAQGSTDSARGLALSLIKPGYTFDQISGLVETIKFDMRQKVQGYQDQRNEIQKEMASPIAPPATAAPIAGGTPPAKTDPRFAIGSSYNYKDGRILTYRGGDVSQDSSWNDTGRRWK